MAVYQGARPRTFGLPGRPRQLEAPTPALPRRRARAAVRANRTVHARPGLLLGLIDIGRLQVDQERLDARLQEITSDLSRLGREPAVRKLALDAGLGELGEAVVLPAR